MSIPQLLVVDDDPFMVRLLGGILRGGPWEIRLCSNPREAVLLAQTHTWSALITDLNMPECDGLDLIRISHLRDPTTRVVVMTALDPVPPASEFARVDLILRKPVERDVLLNFLHRQFAIESGKS